MISFTVADVDRFLAEDNGARVVLLNLLRFRPDGGRERYFEYFKNGGPLVARRGAEIIFAGDGGNAAAGLPGSGKRWREWRRR